MKASLNRISAVFLRYLYLHKRSVSRLLEFFFWPVMELLVWGFLTVYLKNNIQGPMGQMMSFLLSGAIFWDILYRAQQGVTISIMEDIWTYNIINVLISPLRIWEWFVATFLYGFFKVTIITLILSLLSLGLYQFNLVTSFHFYLVPLVINLLLFGWALGIFTSGLLIRWGHAVEALIWGIPFLIQPISAIYYPLSVLPTWVQKISLCIPSTYVFEGMRLVIQTSKVPTSYILRAFLLNGVFFILSALFYKFMYDRARVSGRLTRLGMD